jgi:pimeloyl-ACP methyl ester carboxylesterase
VNGDPSFALRPLGGDGPVLVLAHANGFPIGSYRVLAGLLATRFRVMGYEARPLWPGSDPGELRGWTDLGDDLRTVLRGASLSGIVGVGHSVGAVSTILASTRDPDLFRTRVLIDPVLFTGPRARLWGLFQAFGLASRMSIVRGARQRRESWTDPAEAHQSWAAKPLFARWEPRCLDDYVESGLVPDPHGGFRLRYPRAWEAAIFETTPSDPWPWVREVKSPSLFLRGSDSETFLPEASERVRREVAGCEIREVPGTTHLLPFERPDAVAEAILDFLSLGM